MSGRKVLRSALIVLAVGLFAACGTSRVLESYPDREIERPLTLPKGLSVWSPIIVAARNDNIATQGGASAVDMSFSFYPWYWELGLTDRFTLIWFPIPLAARYSVLRHARGELAVAFNLIGEPYYRRWDFDWSPYFEVLTRNHISTGAAVETRFLAQADVRRSGDPLSGTLSWELGSRFQLNSLVAVRPYLEPGLEFGSPRARYLGSLPPADSRSPHFRLPLGAKLNWQFANLGKRPSAGATNLELAADIRWLDWTYPDEYRSFQSILRVNYFF